MEKRVLVCQGRDKDGQECRYGITDIIPIDVTYASENEYSRGIRRNEKSAAYFLIMSDPTTTRALPVAQGGMDAKIGAKNMETKNMIPVTIAVIPVLPPSDPVSGNPIG